MDASQSQLLGEGQRSAGHILIVEDDAALAELLSMEFAALQYRTEQIHDGDTALRALLDGRPCDLLILDLNLPKVAAITILKQIRRERPKVPVLVLTARANVEERVETLQCGADDCLVKPFSLLELIARVQALLRRASPAVPTCSKVGDLVLNRDDHQVERNGRRIELTPREYAILDVMMRQPGKAVSRKALLEEVWNTKADASTNIVDVYMKYLRDKIDLPGEPKLTRTVRGFGYELRAS